MRVVATSDLHGSLPEIPECDLLLIGGDVCPVMGSHSPSSQQRWMKKHFIPWLADQPAKDIVWIGGNHDFVCQSKHFSYVLPDIEKHATYLFDNTHEVQGLRIFGSPWTPNLRNWAFFKDDADWRDYANKLPDADIYLIHSPPAGILCGGNPQWGSPSMAAALYKKKPKAVVFGHIHEGYGKEVIGLDEIPFYNVAYMNEYYDVDNPNPPQEFEL